MLEYKDRYFLLLIEVDKDENLLDEKLVLEKIIDNKDEYLQMINDKKLYEVVSSMFAKMLLQDLK